PPRVTYDPPCHLLHAQRIAGPPLAVLRAIPDLTLIPLTDAEQCCGAPGIYNLLAHRPPPPPPPPRVCHPPHCLDEPSAPPARPPSDIPPVHAVAPAVTAGA